MSAQRNTTVGSAGRRRRQGGRPPTVERLERRALFAGVVEAFVAGGHLFLRGDAGDNTVAITAGSAPGEITVRGLDGTMLTGQAGAGGETGATNATGFTGVIGDVRVRLDGGDDVLLIGAEEHHAEAGDSASLEAEEPEEHELFSLPRTLDIDTGHGNDAVRVQSVSLGGNLSVATGHGDDTIDIGRGPTVGHFEHHEGETAEAPGAFLAAGTVAPSAGEGEGEGHGEGDAGHGEGGPRPDVLVAQRAQIRTDGGADAVKVAFARVGDDLRIDTGAEQDMVITGRGPVRGVHGDGEDHDGGDGGHGDGRRPPDLRIGRTLRIHTGEGDGFTVLRNTRVGAEFVYAAGAGSDAVAGQNLRVLGPASIATDDGTDRVALYESAFDGALAADTGAGDDVVAFVASALRGPTALRTGAGGDAAVFSGNTADDAMTVEAGADDDVVALLASNTFAGTVTIDGGDGTDRLLADEAATVGGIVILNGEPDGRAFDVEAALGSLADRFTGFLQGR